MGTQGFDKEVVFLSGKRTPFGTFGGSLKDFSATDLGVLSAEAALAEAGVEPADVGHVFYGNALQTSADAIYLARHVGLRAGVPQEAGALTVNRLCGSGFQAIVSGAQEILLGGTEVALCGGTESMSQSPHVVRGARWGDLRLGPAGKGFEDSLWEALLDSHCGLTMAQTAEGLAEQYAVTREEADQVAVNSQMRAKAAWDAGHYDAEVAPVTVRTRKGEVRFAVDEHMRPDTTIEGLARLRPYFRKDGLVTAGNASGIGDGAASVVIADRRWAEANAAAPIGRLVSWGFAGVDPGIMGIGPAPAARNALGRVGLTLEDMELVEINEAFAAQYKSVEKELGLDPARTNVNGGAIAITHPLAASGARITLHLLHELRRRGGRYGLGAACIGGGQGGAVVVEAF
ncbi:MAG: acetyl-CoA C-acyltransferase [Gemmatimonadetes bacterium]|nr:acetyl-CoA C-acyltransferase [Gemmatimonadota bacterium]MXX35927.1 acetyl-CoA C-acyltransferase [Gemmatimonadota bacterium]MYA12662.1 acetyl-CoA C-acyltransferase [Gemmatimonadota bacterium]MYD13333.1 acetyl-CoA C-acyltransferase [Gemmatimonadota bacterium]MYE71069.1 acetyl-CoA C-acyltransferase [Gemmatimonadota bacterium]